MGPKVKTRFFKFLLVFMVGLIIFSFPLNPVWCKQITSDVYSQLKFRYIGPPGNRVTAVEGIPGHPKVYYAGAASGGVWKSVDGGVHWKPIFDHQPAQSIGDLAVAPSDPNIIWVGTGEAFIRSNISIGNGVYKSTDGGENWKHMGLEKTGRISRIVIHPHNPRVVYVAALGHCYGPQEERGVFRTIDGGKTWEKVLFVDQHTGCSDLTMDPNNPRILFAGMWQLVIHTYGRVSGGPGSGLYMSPDGGETWKHLTGHGLPHSPLGKIAVAVAPSNSQRVYALIETGDGVPWKGKKTSSGVLWRSDDGGKNWHLVNHDHTLTQRPHYYSRLTVAPDDCNEVYFCAVRLTRSLDGGLSYKRVPVIGGDNHDIWIDPTDASRIVVGNDQVVSISVNRGESWSATSLPVAQMYHVAVDNQVPYYVYGNRQDGPSCRGPSNSLQRGGIPSGRWHSVGGCESGFAIPDPVENNIVWSGCYGGSLSRFNLETGQSRSVSVWPDNTMGWPATELKYRFQWTFPIAISPHNHNQVYVGSQYVHMTTDGGQSWEVISPDLTTNDKSRQQSSGGLTPDNASVEYACVIFAIAESPVEEGVIWAGTNDGLVHVTKDGGKNWENVTSNIPHLPPWGTVSNIEPSRYEAGSCYLTFDFHQMNDRNPYVYKTENYGKSWKLISSDIPRSVFSYTHCVREDPQRKGMLYLGTENSLYVSFDEGESWCPLQNNLPHAPVHWMTIQKQFNDLVIATYGRGFWILDDITPLQQLNPEILKSDAHLFKPRPAYRFGSGFSYMRQPVDLAEGDNPPYGACINYYLKNKPEEKVEIIILDDKGEIIRTLKGTKEEGINRIWWDLRYEPAEKIKLRTPPLYADWVEIGKKGWRSLVTWARAVSPRVKPGIYTVQLKLGEKELSQKLEVKKDPRIKGNNEDIQAQVNLLLELRENINKAVHMVNKMEIIRMQLDNLVELLKDEESKEELNSAIQKLDKKVIQVEKKLIQLKLTGASQDALRWPIKLYAKMASLSGRVDNGDFPPTDQQVEVHQMYEQKLSEVEKEFSQLLSEEVVGLNQFLQENGIPHIIVSK